LISGNVVPAVGSLSDSSSENMGQFNNGPFCCLAGPQIFRLLLRIGVQSSPHAFHIALTCAAEAAWLRPKCLLPGTTTASAQKCLTALQGRRRRLGTTLPETSRTGSLSKFYFDIQTLYFTSKLALRLLSSHPGTNCNTIYT